MENLKSFEQLAAQAILSGKSWNGKFYDMKKKGTFVFVGGGKYQIVNQSAFLSVVSEKKIDSKMEYREAYDRFGFDFAEEGNY